MAEQRRRTVSPAPRNTRVPPSGQPIESQVSPGHRSIKKVSHRLDKLESDGLLLSLKQNRQRLCACFDIFEILYQNSVPQRCLEHNNFLTLYCENQQKLLCVNCIYGNVHHRLHTVAPIKNVFEKIIEDNKSMEKRLLQAIETIKLTEKAANDYTAEGHQGLNRVLRQLDEEFERLRSLITEKYNQSRSIIMEQFNDAKLKNDLLLQQIAWLKTTYVDREKVLPRSNEQASVVYSHLMMGALLEGEQLHTGLVRPLNFEQIKNEYIGDLIRIRESIQTGKVRQKRGLF